MNESKAKKLIVASTVGAVLLVVVLITIMLYQLISIRPLRKEIAELENKIQEYNTLIMQGEDTLEVRSMRYWIERRAMELGYHFVNNSVDN